MPKNLNRTQSRKERIGIVLSDKMSKTIVVQIKRKALHPLYGKVIQKAVKFKAHDEKNEAKTGDTVKIVETRPLSKEKRWRLVEVMGRAKKKAADEVKDDFEQLTGIQTKEAKPVQVEGTSS